MKQKYLDDETNYGITYNITGPFKVKLHKLKEKPTLKSFIRDFQYTLSNKKLEVVNYDTYFIRHLFLVYLYLTFLTILIFIK